MKTTMNLFLFIVALCSLTSCDDAESIEEKKPTVTLTKAIQVDLNPTERQIVASERENALRFFNLIAQKESASDAKGVPQQDIKDNFMISPYSLNVALSMVWNGAKGETKAAIKEALGYKPEYSEAVNAYHKKMAETLVKTDPCTELLIANSIWYREKANLKSNFKDNISNWYDGKIQGVNFSDANTKNIMNKWCEEKTKGVIKEVVQKTNPDDVMYLMNALYFKGVWTDDYKFEKSETRKETFTLENGDKIKVPMMQQVSKMFYTKNDIFSAVSLPYGNEAYSMFVLLPNENKSVAEMAKQLAQDKNLANTLRSYSNYKVTLSLPKFKFKYNANLNMTLREMGMAPAFQNDADFSGIFEKISCQVSNVDQFTYIDVNEEGTEAAAVTSIGMVTTSIPTTPKEVTFTADRPFVFLIQENSTSNILFMGKVGNPNKEE